MKTLILALILFSQYAHAHPGMPAPVMPKEFEPLKGLVGTWEGTAKMGDKDEAVTVVYELTSAGSALTERLMPGTPNEMISVYHKEGKSVGMTHYCALGNQPHMKLKKTDGKVLVFTMTGSQGLTSTSEPHMHAVTLTIDGNTLTQEWTHYEKGKKSSTAVFKFKKKS